MRLAAGVAGLMMVATACSSLNGSSTTASSTDAPRQGGSLSMALPGEAASLSPFVATYSNVADGTRMNAIYDTLVWENPVTGSVQGQLADSLTPQDATALTWKLVIKPNIQFSDGEPFNAAAVKLNWDTHATPAVRSQQMPAALFIASTKVEPNNPLALDITLRTPNANFDRMVAHNLSYIAAPAGIIRHDLDTNPIGAGPFVLKPGGWIKGTSLTLVRNPNYWQKAQGLPYLDSIVFRPEPNVANAANEIDAGKLDLTVAVNPIVVAQAEKDGIGVDRLSLNGGSLFVFNTATGPLSNPDVRRAFAYALSSQDLINRFYDGKGTPAQGIFSSTSPLANNQLAAGQNDPQQAAALFAKVTNNGTKPLNFTLTAVESPASDGTAKYVVSKLNAYPGVHVTSESLDIASFIQKVNIDKQYDAVLSMTWIDDPEPALNFWLNSTSFSNCCNYSNSKVDAALEDAREKTDPEARREDYTQVQIQLNQDMPFWVFMEDSTAALYAKRVTGVQVYGDGEFMLDRIGIRK